MFRVPGFSSTSGFLICWAGMILITGCGSGGSAPAVLSGNTAVTVLASSTANDQLTQFHLQFIGLTLTNKAGNTVNVITSAAIDPQFTSPTTEFVRLNGSPEPIVTVSIPQDIYTSAIATIEGANFSCIGLAPNGGLDDSFYGYGYVPSSQVSVTLPSPITVTGEAMGLSLDLLVSPSAVYASCYPGTPAVYSINPTFNLTAVPFSGAGAAPQLSHLSGLVASVTSGSFMVKSPDGPVWSLSTNTSTAFQGVAGSSSLSIGMPADVDATIQPDGSLQATRVEISDIDPTNLTVAQGPILFIDNILPMISQFGQQVQGYLPANSVFANTEIFSFGDAAFQLSHSLSNVGSLPFPATFSAASLFAGQNVAMTSHTTSYQGYTLRYPVSTVTLMPQTLNGTVTAISSSGSFTSYTVHLAAYSLMPALSMQQAQTVVLSNPSTVTVYADSSAQTRGGASAIGSVMRFNGLLFNDAGSLKMDCAWTDTGVAP